jgi:hypothetical protein
MKSFSDLTEELLKEETSNDLLAEIEALHKKSFPKGWFKGGTRSGLGGGNTISFSFGIVPEREVSNKILDNDPGHHKFIIHEKEGKYEAKVLHGGLNIDPPEGSNLVMTRVKSKWRKVSGDHKKVVTAFSRFFPKFKGIVKDNKDNIYNADKYSKGLFEEVAPLFEGVKVLVAGEPKGKDEDAFDKLIVKYKGEVADFSDKGMYFEFKDKNTADRFKKDAKKLKSIRIG